MLGAIPSEAEERARPARGEGRAGCLSYNAKFMGGSRTYVLKNRCPYGYDLLNLVTSVSPSPLTFSAPVTLPHKIYQHMFSDTDPVGQALL